jgi:hypothetical protein
MWRRLSLRRALALALVTLAYVLLVLFFGPYLGFYF